MFFFSGKKCSRVLYMHDMIMTFYFEKLYRLKYVLEKKLWKFDNPPLNYRSVMSDNNGIFVMRPEMVFFQEKNIPFVSAVNYKQNSQNTNTFCFPFISSNNVEI